MDGSPPPEPPRIEQQAEPADGAQPPKPAILPPDSPGYTYGPTEYRPRQSREIALCNEASDFDWMYSGSMLLGFVGSQYASLGYLKHSDTPAVRMIGPGLIGFFWGGLLSGSYLSLPKCDPLWAWGPPPEGNVRAQWPLATAITLLAMVTAPAMDFVFLGPVPIDWPVQERSIRVFVAMGTGALGSLFPYLLPPKTWAAKKEIERIRIGEVAGGPFLSYGYTF